MCVLNFLKMMLKQADAEHGEPLWLKSRAQVRAEREHEVQSRASLSRSQLPAVIPELPWLNQLLRREALSRANLAQGKKEKADARSNRGQKRENHTPFQPKVVS